MYIFQNGWDSKNFAAIHYDSSQVIMDTVTSRTISSQSKKGVSRVSLDMFIPVQQLTISIQL